MNAIEEARGGRPICSKMDGTGGSHLIKRINRVICHVWRPRDSQDTVYKQIVLAKNYYLWVIGLADGITLAGHLGRERLPGEY